MAINFIHAISKKKQKQKQPWLEVINTFRVITERERLWYPQWAFPSVQACLRRGLVYHWFYCHLKSHSNKQRVRSCRAVLNLLISLVCLLEARPWSAGETKHHCQSQLQLSAPGAAEMWAWAWPGCSSQRIISCAPELDADWVRLARGNCLPPPPIHFEGGKIQAQ